MKEFIITAAAKLIKGELRDLDKMNKVYPMFHQLSDIKDQKEWVHKSLQLLLSYLITCLKQVIIIILCYFFIIHMLLYHWNGKMSEIIFNSKKLETSQSIASACSNLDNKEHFIFAYAWSGCDTVSATFGKGKASFLKLLKS